MRRAVLVLGGTAAGLIALFSYKTHVPGPTPVADPSSPAALTSSAPPRTTATKSASATKSATVKPTPSVTKTAAPTTAPTTAPATTTPATIAPVSTPTSTPTTAAPTPTPSKTTATPTPTPTKTAPSGTFSGSAVNTQYGEVQVSITVANGKITSATGSLPDGGDSIAQGALPTLNSEVVQAQSANIQAVSGATYTSQGYIQSLQQAVDQAGL